MRVKILQWNALATWVWDIENEDMCAICRHPFEQPCPKCKVPGDDCVPGKELNISMKITENIYLIKVAGECNHHFHMHCIIRWIEEG